MDIGFEKTYLKNFKKHVNELYDDLKTVDLLINLFLKYSTNIDYSTLITRKEFIEKEIRIYNMAIKYTERKLEMLSRV